MSLIPSAHFDPISGVNVTPRLRGLFPKSEDVIPPHGVGLVPLRYR